jgi:carbonic anhydrase/acetyltransferase-like protein (isoleucine patch superfamily)
MIIPLLGKTPTFGSGTFIAKSADVIGDVKTGKNCSIWYNTSLRGDVMPIVIGDESNIQDNSVLHGTHKKCGAVVGSQVTIGHSVILHGCRIGDLCLIGMGSVVMDLAEIPDNCIVGAGSLVTENAKFPSGHLIMGRPAKAVRPLNEKELAFLPQSAKNYMMYMDWYPNEYSLIPHKEKK